MAVRKATQTRQSRGPVDAPGKRHRKPPPQEVLGKNWYGRTERQTDGSKERQGRLARWTRLTMNDQVGISGRAVSRARRAARRETASPSRI